MIVFQGYKYSYAFIEKFLSLPLYCGETFENLSMEAITGELTNSRGIIKKESAFFFPFFFFLAKQG